MSNIPPEWVYGIHTDGKKAEKQSVQIHHTANTYIYHPTSVFEVLNEELARSQAAGKRTADRAGYEPYKLTLPGVPGYKEAAEAAVQRSSTEPHDGISEQELRIPRRQILFPPTALRATEEFEQAVNDALKSSTDREKFVELQKVFSVFGYYYPYWIIIGGKILYQSSEPLTGTPKKIVTTLFREGLQWRAVGGDVGLLNSDQNVDGWFESTIINPDAIMVLDINPIYDILDDNISSEIQRIYQAHYHRFGSDDERVSEPNDPTSNALISICTKHAKIGVIKGVHISGEQSEEDAVELSDERNVRNFMRLAAAGQKPRIECMVRSAMLGSTIETHAFLSHQTIDGTGESSVFDKTAMDHHIRLNGGALQPSTRNISYFVMYVIYRELIFDPSCIKITDSFQQAISKALGMKSDMEKYQELQKVFGGRITFESGPIEETMQWSSAKGIDHIDRLLQNATIKPNIKIGIIGGAAKVTDCKDWIDSVRNNQTRVQFGQLRPIYELLEVEQRIEALRVLGGYRPALEDFPKIPKGIHFDGTEAEEQAIELVNDETLTKMIMLRNFCDVPNVQHIKRYGKSFEDVERYSSLDIESEYGFPGSHGFMAGAKGAYNERRVIRTSGHRGRITLVSPTQDQKRIMSAQDTDLMDLYRESKRADDKTELNITEVEQSEESNVKEKGPENESAKQIESADNSAVVKLEQTLSRHVATTAIEKSVAKSLNWKAHGGNAICLLQNDVNDWIRTIRSNQSLTQHRNLKPLYELLEEEQQHRVQQTYENVLLADDRVRYHYLVELRIHNDMLEDLNNGRMDDVFESVCNDIDITDTSNTSQTDSLFEELISQIFPDSIVALDFCEKACADHGFRIVKDKVTETIICVYCSHNSPLSEFEPNTQSPNRVCQWGVMLCENDQSQWQFRKFESDEELVHNHLLKEANEPARTSAQRSGLRSKTYVEILFQDPAKDKSSTEAEYLKYGDVVRLMLVHSAQYAGFGVHRNFIRASENVHAATYARHVDVFTRLQLDRQSEVDTLWKVVPCPFTGKNDAIESCKIASDIDTMQDNTSPDNIEHSRHGCYVRNEDVILLESQTLLEGSNRVYLSFSNGQLDCFVAGELREPNCHLAQWHIKHVNQYMTQKTWNSTRSKEGFDSAVIASMRRQAARKIARHQYRLGRAYMYGLYGLDVDKTEALKYLQLAADQGHRESCFTLAKLLWSLKQYGKAIDMYEKATFAQVFEAYRELGNVYHTGLSGAHGDEYAVSQNYNIAYMYYSIGGIFGDAYAAMKVGEYYEKGLNPDFGIDNEKALRWYEYVHKEFKLSAASSAIGRIKHTMANATTDKLESDKLRREAFKAFNAAAQDDTYAKFMVAMYHISEQGCQQPDPDFGFQTLLSLVESGPNMAIKAISQCYALGLGVNRDIEKAGAYHELANRTISQ
ncbi:hypothetical protein EC973_002003 [Apophysomyces ossiformis]|uniref:Uncharacterized protein n=1 Tax=Apophysomyces ossiformis TaxID=679940 RepID=A0A8H7BSZ5_9FUNG|nr:hypothetical protein EC973_002003 [Apophysomyces ossiformis]